MKFRIGKKIFIEHKPEPHYIKTIKPGNIIDASRQINVPMNKSVKRDI